MKIGFRFVLFGAESSESINRVTGAAIKTKLQKWLHYDACRQLLGVYNSLVEKSIVGALHHFVA